MNPVDRFSYLLHLAIAEKLRVDGGRVVEVARRNIAAWLASGRFENGAENVFVKWQSLLENSITDEIIRLITQDNDQGQRLRSSSPFTGILTSAERDQIWSECAEVRLA